MDRYAHAAVVVTLLLMAGHVRAAPSSFETQVGDTYEIAMRRVSSHKSSNGSSSSSSDGGQIVERVNGLRPEGLELQYDLPDDTSAEDRAASWEFPVRVLKPNFGAMQLLNRSELEARVETWLKANGIDRAACGQWIFTWSAFRIECDPQSVIETLEVYDLRTPSLREGAEYKAVEARRPAPLVRKAVRIDGATFAAQAEIDPEIVRRQLAEADVVSGQLTNKPLTLDTTLRDYAQDAISGSILVTFDTDADGSVRQRTKVTNIEVKRPAGGTETTAVTEIVERRLISQRAVNH